MEAISFSLESIINTTIFIILQCPITINYINNYEKCCILKLIVGKVVFACLKHLFSLNSLVVLGE